MKNIVLSGTFDNSGYGQANKNLFISLLKTNNNIIAQVINTPMSRPEFAQDEDYKTILSHIDPKTKPDIIIAQMVPSLWHYAFKKNIRCIGYLFWESDRICEDWIKIINDGLCSEVWVSCPSNYQALINSGIKKPIFLIPQYIKTTIISRIEAEKILPLPNPDFFRFYSIFQWTERKNGEGLIRAFYNEFVADDKVLLVVKTYGASAFSDRRWIKERILKLKEESGNKNPPPLYLLDKLLTPSQVNSIHPQCNAYVHCGKGEGLNIPLLEAMSYGQQVITTKLGGIADWMDNNTGYIIPHTLENINTNGMPWGMFYISNPPQQWGGVRDKDIQTSMRLAFNEKNDCPWRISNYVDILDRCSEGHMINEISKRL